MSSDLIKSLQSLEKFRFTSSATARRDGNKTMYGYFEILAAKLDEIVVTYDLDIAKISEPDQNGVKAVYCYMTREKWLLFKTLPDATNQLFENLLNNPFTSQ